MLRKRAVYGEGGDEGHILVKDDRFTGTYRGHHPTHPLLFFALCLVMMMSVLTEPPLSTLSNHTLVGTSNTASHALEA